MMKQLIILIGICCAASFLMSDDKKADNSAIIKAVMTTVDADMKKGYAGRKQAIKKLEQLLTIDTDCIEAYFKLAECYRRNSKKEKAIEYYKNVVDKIGAPTVGDLGMWYNESIKYLDKLDPVSREIRTLKEQHVAGLKALYRRYKDKRIADELTKLDVEIEHKQSVAGTVTVKVDADKPWQDTGIKLQKGVTYLITAEGKWSGGLETKGLVSPDGESKNFKSYIFQGFPAYSLIGKVNNSTFTIGSKTKLIISEEGKFEMQMNDGKHTSNNKGTLTVTIKRLK